MILAIKKHLQGGPGPN